MHVVWSRFASVSSRYYSARVVVTIAKIRRLKRKRSVSLPTPYKKLSGVLESEDPAAIKVAFTAAETALTTVAGDPPKDIATDVATIKAKFTAANDAMKKANYDLDQIDKSSSKAVTDLEDPEFTKAGDNVQAWTTKNCA